MTVGVLSRMKITMDSLIVDLRNDNKNKKDKKVRLRLFAYAQNIVVL